MSVEIETRDLKCEIATEARSAVKAPRTRERKANALKPMRQAEVILELLPPQRNDALPE